LGSWYGADLRPEHFLALHLAQLSFAGSLVASALLPSPVAIVLTLVGILGWSALTWLIFINASSGSSLAKFVGF
jgi:hypothetical protein